MVDASAASHNSPSGGPTAASHNSSSAGPTPSGGPTMSDGAIVWAPPKINLVLRVGARRADGYHEVLTLMARGGPGDVLAIAPAPPPKITSATAVPTRSCVACWIPRSSTVAAPGVPAKGSTLR